MSQRLGLSEIIECLILSQELSVLYSSGRSGAANRPVGGVLGGEAEMSGSGTDARATRQAILAAASEIFAAEAYAAVNVGDVAKRAGVAHGSVFYHFKDKRGLYVATLVSLLSALDRHVAPPAATAGSTAEMIRETLARYFEYVGRYPAVMTTLLRVGQHDPDLRTPYIDARTLGLGRVLTALGVSVEAPPPLLRSALRGWMGFTDAVAADWLTNDQDLPVPECVDLCVDALTSALHSCGVPDHPWSGPPVCDSPPR